MDESMESDESRGLEGVFVSFSRFLASVVCYSSSCLTHAAPPICLLKSMYLIKVLSAGLYADRIKEH